MFSLHYRVLEVTGGDVSWNITAPMLKRLSFISCQVIDIESIWSYIPKVEIINAWDCNARMKSYLKDCNIPLLESPDSILSKVEHFERSQKCMLRGYMQCVPTDCKGHLLKKH